MLSLIKDIISDRSNGKGGPPTDVGLYVCKQIDNLALGDEAADVALRAVAVQRDALARRPAPCGRAAFSLALSASAELVTQADVPASLRA